MKRHVLVRPLVMLGLLSAAFGTHGCASRSVGATRGSVTFVDVAGGTNLYLVPFAEWAKQGSARFDGNLAELSKHESLVPNAPKSVLMYRYQWVQTDRSGKILRSGPVEWDKRRSLIAPK
jgi:hypothetical protein